MQLGIGVCNYFTFSDKETVCHTHTHTHSKTVWNDLPKATQLLSAEVRMIKGSDLPLSHEATKPDFIILKCMFYGNENLYPKSIALKLHCRNPRTRTHTHYKLPIQGHCHFIFLPKLGMVVVNFFIITNLGITFLQHKMKI